MTVIMLIPPEFFFNSVIANLQELTKLSRTNALFVPSSEQHYCKHDFKLVV